MAAKNLAAIDMGTNSCRIRITDPNGNIIYREALTIRLGEGMHKSGQFTPEAISRGLKCLTHFSELMNDYDVGHYRAIATASCRMAANGTEFIKSVEELCNIKFDIISPEEEAILNLRGAMLNAPKSVPYILVYDLGGGSTEITLATNEQQPKVLYTISIPWGARNASEAFDILEYNEENAEKLRAEVKKYTQDFLLNSEFLMYKPNCFCLATSSTPLRLFSMLEKTQTYNKDYADGLTEKTADISKLIDEIKTMDFVKLSESPYIGNNRAPIFMAACVIFKTIYEELQIETLTASLKGAQEAIIEDLAAKWQS